MQKHTRLIIFCLLSTMPLARGWAQGGGSQASPLTSADSFYAKGDCKSALPLFGNLLKHPENKEVYDEALFKSSYCHLTLGENEKAAAGFKQYLAEHPENDEARLRYSESLFNLSDFTGAKNAAAKVKDPDFKAEATIFVARSSIETQDFGAAIGAIRAVKSPGDWNPVLLYWQGIAYYNLNDLEKAESAFTHAAQVSPQDLWVKAEAQKSIEALKKENRRLRGFLSVGYFTDSNAYQTGNDVPATDTPSGATTTNISKSDKGAWLSGETSYLPYLTGDASLAANLYYSSPYYEKFAPYDYQYAAFELAYREKFNKDKWLGFAGTYSESFYNGVHYQDYEAFTPSASWTATKNLYFDFSVPVTLGIASRPSTTVAPTLGVQFTFDPTLSLRAGASYSSTSGTDAVYTGTGAGTSYSSGVQFSSYATTGAYMGFYWAFVDSLGLSAQVATYSTLYKKEALPSNVNVPTAARSDSMVQAQVELSGEIIKDLWSGGLSYTATSNKSSGFQGLSSSGWTSNYTYDRSYILLRTTIIY